MKVQQCFTVAMFQDGENEPTGVASVLAGWRATWSMHYALHGDLEFQTATNLKQFRDAANRPPALQRIAEVRNPDIYFAEVRTGTELGGIEITDHSPDGSNVEKRYPFLWIARREGVHAFIASPYSKTRLTGQINKLPYRHSHRNVEFLDEWSPSDNLSSTVRQIVPVADFHIGGRQAPTSLEGLLITWEELGGFFAHALASRVLVGALAIFAASNLAKFKDRLRMLADACMAVTNDTPAASLAKVSPSRWIQTYNTRPDSGHWERGEGQFDSIDGRLMFTLDEISLLPSDGTKPALEFWLPQMTTQHPWIVEQRQRGYGSKRLRNIMVTMSSLCVTKFADQLTAADWQLLEHNQRLVLERLDWEPGIYRVVDLVPANKRSAVAGTGLKNTPQITVTAISTLLSDSNLYFSAHRAYRMGWRDDLLQSISQLSSTARILVPRIPKQLLTQVAASASGEIVPAEECTREELMMLRQLHKAKPRIREKVKA